MQYRIKFSTLELMLKASTASLILHGLKQHVLIQELLKLCTITIYKLLGQYKFKNDL